MQLEIGVELLAYLLAAAAMTALGLAAEANSLLRFAAGETTVGVWLGAIGLLLLYGGVYLLGYEKVAKTVLGTNA